MGHRKYNVRLSIKGQVTVAVILILICSFFATIATYFGIAVSMRPSSAAERAAVALERYVAKQGAAVLKPSAQRQLQTVVKGAGVEYLVLDSGAHPIYGTLSETTVTNRADMFRKMNVASVDRRGFEFGSIVDKVIPVLGKGGSLVGAVYMKWTMLPGGVKSPNVWTQMLTFAFFLSPFFYMLLFTYIFARRVGRKLNRPLQALIEATRRIQQRDLDFTIDYYGKNEIGKVLDAFEDMRKGLKESLLAQWSLEEERREMLAAISHDLRTPITIIQGHAETLLEQPTINQDRLERYLQTIVRNTNRVVRLMNDFRTVTDIDSPGFSLHPSETDLKAYFAAKYTEFLVLTQEHGIALDLDLSDSRRDQCAMWIDTDRVSQIMDNLMSNAIRFTPDGGHIHWRVQVDEGRLSVVVEDTGQGFPTGAADRLFNKFYQGDKSRSGQKGHAGLGLYIVKALVEKHGGSITAERNDHGGATFRFEVLDQIS